MQVILAGGCSYFMSRLRMSLKEYGARIKAAMRIHATSERAADGVPEANERQMFTR